MSEQTDIGIMTKIEPPQFYYVVLYNDNVTTVDFVIELLQTVFDKDIATATEITVRVHTEGQGIVDRYPYDIAVSKQMQAQNMAARNNFPLKVGVRL
ncbi:MAG: ATP-dependent Clp protease adaptor ClpS [Defluviitaleaceae bacterium]|nr:ATP-dependent Clp protease adaptor ClpS [Defluviitaleaceae bacterium]